MKHIPLSLYIHIPWCEKKCPYCDFNSHLARTEVDEKAYVDQLLSDLDNEIELLGSSIGEREVQTISLLFCRTPFKSLLNQ